MNRGSSSMIFVAIVLFFAATAQASDLPADKDNIQTPNIGQIISARMPGILSADFSLEDRKIIARLKLSAALEAASRGVEKDVTAVLVGIGAGALFGAIIDGSDGAAKGALIGGAAGVGYVLARRF